MMIKGFLKVCCAGVLIGSTVSFGEVLHIKKKINSPNAGERWEGEQYRKAEQLDRKGEVKKAQEVREFAHKHAEEKRGIVKFMMQVLVDKAAGH